MDCQVIPTAKPTNKRTRKAPKTLSLHEREFFSQPIEASSAVYAVEPGDDEEVEQAEEVLPIDTFQCVPLTEIKLENPFEELPFNWEGEMEDLLEENGLQGWELLRVLDLHDEDKVEEILGPFRYSERAVGGILDNILEGVFRKGETELGNDVEELFNEEVLDMGLEVVRHQVYIKDFSWIPLEDQFLHCDLEEKTQAEALLLLRKLKNVEEQREEVKTLMLSSTDEDMTTQLVLKILGEDALPLKADHCQIKLAAPTLVAAEHCYVMKKKVKSAPASVTRVLTRVRSKACAVSCLPRGTGSNKLAFSAVQPSAIQVSNNNVIRVGKGRGAEKPQKMAATGGERRIDLVVGGIVMTSLAQWREEQTENNNRVEKVEEEGREIG